MTDHLLLGVCDYPEHVPPDRWRTYARQQRELGLTYVRISEFAWSRLEPRPGEFNWAWLDDAIEAYHAEGLKVVLCTPTATPPAWLVRQHPEILAFDEQGRVREFGSRRHYDFASPVYREHSRRITRAIAERYGQHAAVVGWQTDNEFGCHGTSRSYGGASAEAFPHWLRQKYSTLDALNAAWGNVFWSMEYTAWEQIRPPNLTVTEPNPAHLLDFYRFASAMIARFHEEQIVILRELSPGRFITHNFMIFESGFDHYAVARGLDFVSWDNYPTGMLEFFAPAGHGDDLKTKFARTGHPDLVGFNHDLYRGMLERGVWHGERRESPAGHASRVTRRPGFWVMEQQCGQVNWAPWNPLPTAGAVQLWTAQAWAHGADTVCYFRWRAATMAQEVMHSGLLRHDETPDRGHAEVREIVPPNFPLGEVPARVALLHDYESLWLFDAQKHAADLSYWTQTLTYYSALRSLGLDVDVISADADLSGYAVVVAPAITLVMPERAAHWQASARAGAKFVCGPRTAFRTPGGNTWEDGQPGPLSALLGVKLWQYDSLRPGLTQQVGKFEAHAWAESYRLNGAEALYTYQGGPLDGQPAVTRHGHFTVIGAHSPELVQAVLEDVLRGAGLNIEPLPEGVRLSRRAGKTLMQNWNSHEVTFGGICLPPVSFSFAAAEGKDG